MAKNAYLTKVGGWMEESVWNIQLLLMLLAKIGSMQQIATKVERDMHSAQSICKCNAPVIVDLDIFINSNHSMSSPQLVLFFFFCLVNICLNFETVAFCLNSFRVMTG